MAKDKKRCKECEGMGDECKCPSKKKGGRIGWYGLDRDHDSDDDMTVDGHMAAGEGGLGEGIKMPEAPSDTDKSMKDMSSDKKKKNLDSFRAAADDAKKRQKYKQENDELALTRMKKGVRFYDSKGSGYIKGGKKTYD